MKALRVAELLGVPALAVAMVPIAAAKNPVAHVEIKTVQTYQGQAPLPRPDRVVVYEFTVGSAVKTDRMPGVRQRIKQAKSSDDAATFAGEQVQKQIAEDMLKGLQKRLKTSGIPVEKGVPGMEIRGSALVVHGTVTKLDQGHRMRRGTVGMGAGASDVRTDCEITMQTGGKSIMVTEVTTDARSGKRPGAAVTMGAGAGAAVAGGVTGATAHRSTAQGNASRTGSALAKHIANWMTAAGWVPTGNEQAALPQTQQ